MEDETEKAHLQKALREVDAQRQRMEVDRSLLTKDIELLLRTLHAVGLGDPRVPRSNMPQVKEMLNDSGFSCGTMGHNMITRGVTGASWKNFFSGGKNLARPMQRAQLPVSSGAPDSSSGTSASGTLHSQQSTLTQVASSPYNNRKSHESCSCDASMVGGRHLSTCALYEALDTHKVKKPQSSQPSPATTDMGPVKEDECADDGEVPATVRIKKMSSAFRARAGLEEHETAPATSQSVHLEEPKVKHFNSIWEEDELNPNMQDGTRRSIATQTNDLAAEYHRKLWMGSYGHSGGQGSGVGNFKRPPVSPIDIGAAVQAEGGSMYRSPMRRTSQALCSECKERMTGEVGETIRQLDLQDIGEGDPEMTPRMSQGGTPKKSQSGPRRAWDEDEGQDLERSVRGSRKGSEPEVPALTTPGTGGTGAITRNSNSEGTPQGSAKGSSLWQMYSAQEIAMMTEIEELREMVTQLESELWVEEQRSRETERARVLAMQALEAIKEKSGVEEGSLLRKTIAAQSARTSTRQKLDGITQAFCQTLSELEKPELAAPALFPARSSPDMTKSKRMWTDGTDGETTTGGGGGGLVPPTSTQQDSSVISSASPESTYRATSADMPSSPIVTQLQDTLRQSFLSHPPSPPNTNREEHGTGSFMRIGSKNTSEADTSDLGSSEIGPSDIRSTSPSSSTSSYMRDPRKDYTSAGIEALMMSPMIYKEDLMKPPSGSRVNTIKRSYDPARVGQRKPHFMLPTKSSVSRNKKASPSS